MTLGQSEEQRWVESWSRDVNEQVEQSIEFLEHAVDRKVTVFSPDRLIEVRLDGAGMLTGLVLDEQIRSLRPDELAAEILATVQAAHREVAEQVRVALADPSEADMPEFSAADGRSQYWSTPVDGGWYAR